MAQTVNSLGEPINPAHTVIVEQSRDHVIVEFGGEVIADSRKTLLVQEVGCPPRRYFPPDDVRGELLQRDERVVHCPYKGDWSPVTIRAGGQQLTDGGWTYHTTLEECPRIKDYVAFYEDKLTVKVGAPDE